MRQPLLQLCVFLLGTGFGTAASYASAAAGVDPFCADLMLTQPSLTETLRFVGRGSFQSGGRLEPSPGESKIYSVRFARSSEKAASARIVDSPSLRELVLPPVTEQELAPNLAPELIQNWLVGSAQHPFGGPRVHGVRRLRTVQMEAIRAATHDFDSGRRSFLYVAPTGTGKSEVFFHVLDHELARNQAGLTHLVLVHQNEISDQLTRGAKRIAREYGAEVSQETEALERRRDKDPSQVVSITIQALEAWVSQASAQQINSLRSRLGLVIFDEAHHVGASTWLEAIKKLLANNPKSKFLAATATPVHRDAKIQELFSELFEGRSFWAYLDHDHEAEGIARDVRSVVAQLSAAIAQGELTQLGKFYALDPYSFTSDRNSIFAKGSQISPQSYRLLAKRLAPLLQQHRAGFFAVNSIEEAETLAADFQTAFPHKRFIAYHGSLPARERTAIEARMRGGEDLFLFTVNLLDEGVDFPHLSLYVDLNRSLGVRQLLQRWGRVARLATGKTAIDIVTLSDWRDADQIADKLALIEAFTKDSGRAFQSDVVAQARDSERTIPHYAPIAGALVLNDYEHQLEVQRLKNSIREIFDRSERLGPWERINARVSRGEGLPKQAEDASAHVIFSRLLKAYPDPKKWRALVPEITEATIEALISYQEKREAGGPWNRIIERVSRGEGLPKIAEDKGAYLAFMKLLKNNPDSKKWRTLVPEMTDTTYKALLNYRAAKTRK